MKATKYRITTLSPLILTSKTGDPNMVSSLDHIPGTALRGLFANEYLSRGKLRGKAESDQKFADWFIRGNLKFLNAYPSEVVEGINRNYYPIPLSLQREKHGEKIYNLFHLEDDQNKTPDTKAFDCYGSIEHGIIYTKSVKKSINFHHKRDRKRGVSEENIIFNYESIDPDQTFEGYILGDTDSLRQFQETFSQGIYRIGRSRHSQYGLIQLEYITEEPDDFLSDSETFDFDGDEVVLALLSDTVILNEWGFSTANVSDFERATGLKVKKSIIRATVEEAYLSIWKSKTPSHVCFKAGSSFLVELNSDSEQKIKKLLIEGIGELTHLGFGRFMVLSNEKKNYALHTTEKESILLHEKPTHVSETTKNLITKIIENAMIEQVQDTAIREANNFKNGKVPPSSLISKLLEATRQGKLRERLSHMEGKAAKTKLEQLNNGREKLYDFLLKKNIEPEHILRNVKGLEGIEDERLFEIFTPSLEKLLEEKFFTTFLSVLRVRAKGGTNA